MANTTDILPLSSHGRVLLALQNRIQRVHAAFWRQVDRVGVWLDAREALLVACLVLAYIVIVFPLAYFRPLWHDELFTYNIGLSDNLTQMMDNLRRVDLNPPLIYILNYVTLRLPGALANDHTASLAARLPSIAGGLMASLGVFVLLRRRIGPLFSCATVVLLWNTLFLPYACEDRPYALVCGLLVLLAIAWQHATQAGRNPLWVAAVCCIGCGLLGSHFMGSFLLLAFVVAEVAQIWQRRRLDISLCFALLVPFAIPMLYRGMISTTGSTIYPLAFQPSGWTFVVEYLVLLGTSLILFIVSWVLCLEANTTPESVDQAPSHLTPSSVPPTLPEWLLLIVVLLEPMMFTALFMLRHAAFFGRYGLPGCIPLAILLVLFLYRRFHGLRRTAVVLLAVSALTLLVYPIGSITRAIRGGSENDSSKHSWSQVSPELPLVAASGLTFVEMNHRESSDLLRRTYYLTDRQAAIAYAHATLFENEAETSRIFHFRGQVLDLRSFEATHPRFLVLGTLDYPEDWLLRKLLADGASLRLLGKYETSYKDKSLYEVTLNQKP
jgi:hypothetical protein